MAIDEISLADEVDPDNARRRKKIDGNAEYMHRGLPKQTQKNNCSGREDDASAMVPDLFNSTRHRSASLMFGFQKYASEYAAKYFEILALFPANRTEVEQGGFLLLP